MRQTNHPANPFPGLRPFEPSETHLFFGRDGQSEELLRRLKRTRFLAVVGTSGSGKSSLVRAGLLPALQGGLMASAGSDWRIAILRPGDDPIGNLARALAAPEMLGSGDEKDAEMQAVLAETTLRRSSLGLVELVRRARTKLDAQGEPLFADYENLLVVVDQFEELFRFKQLIEEAGSQEDAAAFVKLLLEAVGQAEEKKIYIVLTMRSDFLGDSAQFRDLPEAINDGQYLIPRMSRDERRMAITGPVAVGQGAITEPLVNQLLNDVGDNPDQLPILQHALMRTWDYWLDHRQNGEPIDIPHYERIGGMANALSLHADDAYANLNADQQLIAEKLFKGLTERGADNREIRRPVELRQISEMTGADIATVIPVVEEFRRTDRSFLMPPFEDPQTGAHIPLDGESLIDISHESLIRNWKLLKKWVEEEAVSASMYKRLAEAAVRYREQKGSLWRGADLQFASTWYEESRPNETWASRYHPEFATAISFLEQSVEAREAEIARDEAHRRKEIKRTRMTALIFALAFLSSLGMGVYAYGKKNAAESALAKADAAQKFALERATEADKERARAEVQASHARNSELLAKDAEEIAKDAEEIAKDAEEAAKNSEKRALAKKEEAEESRVEAERQRQNAVDTLAKLELANAVTKEATAGKEKAAKAAEEVLAMIQEIDESVPFYYAYARYSKDSPPLVNASFIDSGDMVLNTFGSGFYTFKRAMNMKEDSSGQSLPISPDHGKPGIRPALFVPAALNNFAFAFLPGGDSPAFATVDESKKNIVKLWKPGAKEPMPLMHDDEVRSIAADAAGRQLVTASADGSVHVWDAAEAELVKDWQGHLLAVNSAVFSRDGERVLTASEDGSARLWNAKTGAELSVLRGHDAGVNKAIFSPDESLILTVSRDRTARLWKKGNKEEWETLQVLDGHTEGVTDAAFSPDGKRLATASLDRTAFVWQMLLMQGRKELVMEWKNVAVLRGHIRPVTSVDFSKDDSGNYVVTTGADKTTRVWNLTELKGFRVAKVELEVRQDGYEGLCPAPLKVTGKIIAKGASGGKVRYRFVRRDGNDASGPGDGSPAQEIVFDGPGEKDVSWTWEYDPKAGEANGTVGIEIIEPQPEEPQAGPPTSFKITCEGTRALLTDEQLKEIMPSLPAEKRALYLAPLRRAMLEFGIDTPQRQAAFLAAIAFETAELRFLQEPASGDAYEKMSALGNTQPGDGRRFKGRSPALITGRDNYKDFSELLDLDLVANPEMAVLPDVTFRIAAVYWEKRGANEWADIVEGPEEFADSAKKILLVRWSDPLKASRYFEHARRVLLNPQPSGEIQKLDLPKTPGGHGITIHKTNVNGTGTNSAIVAPGTVVPVIVSYTITDKDCPGCVDQIQVGLVTQKEPSGCLYSGSPGAEGESGKAMFTVTAPREPGVYLIGFGRSQFYACNSEKRWWNQWKDEPGVPVRQRYMGIIEVK